MLVFAAIYCLKIPIDLYQSDNMVFKVMVTMTYHGHLVNSHGHLMWSPCHEIGLFVKMMKPLPYKAPSSSLLGGEKQLCQSLISCTVT